MENALNRDTLYQSKGSSSNVLYEHAMRLLSSCEAPILDLGCGQGSFLKFLRSIGHPANSLTGCDGYRYEEFKNTGCTFVEADLNQKLPFEENQFATVTAIEVIEHLENPRAFLREAVRVLKPGGTLVVSTPNNESLTSLLSLLLRGYHSAFADACYPAHITALLRVDLQRIFRELWLDDIRFSWSDSGRIAGTNVHWQTPSAGLLKGRLFSDSVFIQGIKEPRAT